jgi:hypothetical protein
MAALSSTVNTTDSTSESNSGHHRKRALDRSPDRFVQTNMLLTLPDAPVP